MKKIKIFIVLCTISFGLSSSTEACVADPTGLGVCLPFEVPRPDPDGEIGDIIFVITHYYCSSWQPSPETAWKYNKCVVQPF